MYVSLCKKTKLGSILGKRVVCGEENFSLQRKKSNNYSELIFRKGNFRELGGEKIGGKLRCVRDPPQNTAAKLSETQFFFLICGY